MKSVILQNKDYRIASEIPVVGDSGKKYARARFVPGKKLFEAVMPFDLWAKNAWDIALGGRRPGNTFFVADIIDDSEKQESPPPPPKKDFLANRTFRELRSMAKKMGHDVTGIVKSADLVALLER